MSASHNPGIMPGQQHVGSGLPVRQPGAGARLVKYEPWPFPNPSLIGHATVDFSGWIVSKIPIFRRSDGSLSAGVPNAAEVDRDGRQKERDGKKQYWSVITFVDGDAKERWMRAVLNALATGGIVP